MVTRIRDALVGLAAALLSAIVSVAALTRITPKEEQREPKSAEAQVHKTNTSRDASHDAGNNGGEGEQPPAAQPVQPRGFELQPGWSLPQPAELPKPTYWPAVMSLGVTLLFWGVVTSVLISAVGLLLFMIALAGWIGDIRNENREHGEQR